MISRFLRYLKRLDKTGTCPGIRGRKVYVAPGNTPWDDVDRAVTFRKSFDYDAIVYYYTPSELEYDNLIRELDTVTEEFNRKIAYTDCICMFMDPRNPTNRSPQPPAPSVIIQSYSELEIMRRGWKNVQHNQNTPA